MGRPFSKALSLIFFGLLAAGASRMAHAHPAGDAHDATATYIANEGVLVVDGEMKILFDPLFHESIGRYLTPSEEQRAAILAGKAPYDGVDVMFVSHAHSDHFAADDANAWMKKNRKARLVAPQQAVDAMREDAGWRETFSERMIPIGLAFGDEAFQIAMSLPDGLLQADAVRIPHAGWPGRADIQNIVYRVSLSAHATVMHMGDADPNDDHYAPYDDVWAARRTDLAFPPYWFFASAETHAILKERLNVATSVGVHVPARTPPGLEAAKRRHGIDFFSEPGETRPINHSVEGDEQ